MKTLKRTLLPAILFSSINGFASPIFNSSNNHYYDFIDFDDVIGRLSWEQAQDYATHSSLNISGYQNGYLATVTSAAEDEFIWGLLDNHDNILASGRFLGGYEITTTNDQNESQSTWHWVTNEAFDYTNWLIGEPNNDQNLGENYLMYWWNADQNGGRWNDTTLSSCVGSNCATWGFIVEYAPTVVPAPTAAWLFVSGLGLIAGWRKRKLMTMID